MSRQGHAAHADAQHGRAVKTRQELLMAALTDLSHGIEEKRSRIECTLQSSSRVELSRAVTILPGGLLDSHRACEPLQDGQAQEHVDHQEEVLWQRTRTWSGACILPYPYMWC